MNSPATSSGMFCSELGTGSFYPVPCHRQHGIRVAAEAATLSVRLLGVGRSIPGAERMLKSILSRSGFVLLFAALAILIQFPAAFAAEPGVAADQQSLHEIIDQELAPPAGINVGVCSDAEFIRRASLDLIGMPPRADEVREFLNDNRPDKRTLLIDRLMTTPQHYRHLASALDVMLMERRPYTHVTREEWMNWLMTSVRQNKPWDQFAREMLLADGTDPANRAPARFALDRNAEPNILARDIGRIFFARDMQCAQCHDSPLVNDFLQSDYQGLLALVSPGYAVVRKVNEKDVTVFAEKAPSEIAFESVFIKGTQHRTGPRVPGGVALAEPVLYPGEEYAVAPADQVRSVPKFSRRELLAAHATNGSNRAFNQNIANRLWAMMFGRGLIHPLDMIHADNAPASAALLRTVSERLVATKFDMRSFLREVALSRAYQAPFDLPETNTTAADLGIAELAVQKQKLETLKQRETELASAWETATAAYDAAEAALIPVAAEFDTVRNQYADGVKKREEAKKAAGDAVAATDAKKKIADSVQQASDTAKSAFQELPGDAELMKVANVLSNRAAQLQTEVSGLQKASEEKTAAVKPLEDALVPIRSQLDAIQVKLTPLRDALAKADEARVAIRVQFQDASLEVAQAEKQIRIGESFVSLVNNEASLASTRTEATKHEQELLAATQRVTQFAPRMAETTMALETARKALDAATTAVGTAAASAESQQKQVTMLAEALASVERARDASPADTEISETTQALSGQVERLRSQHQSAMTELAAMEVNQKNAVAAAEVSAAELKKVTEELESLKSQAATTEEKVRSLRTKLGTDEAAIEKTAGDFAGELSARFHVAGLKALSPEQLCFTVFRVTTVYDRYIAAERAELEKTSPLTDAQKNDPVAVATREFEVEQRVYDKLQGYVDIYVSFYGGGPGQPQGDFYASPDQALFTSNANEINGWVVPAGDNASERIVKTQDAGLAAEELYLGVLSRMPTDEEKIDVRDFLAARSDRSLAARELMWALISSAEFRFNR
ncbi:MAG: DUF1549 domain-containing protein [Planctomyces sp.]